MARGSFFCLFSSPQIPSYTSHKRVLNNGSCNLLPALVPRGRVCCGWCSLCSCPLPGTFSFLAGRAGNQDYRLAPFTLGIFVATGLSSLCSPGVSLLGGLDAGGGGLSDIFTPVAFIILLILSLVLIFDISFRRFSRKSRFTAGKSGSAAVFLGLAFGIIILPCNAAAVCTHRTCINCVRTF